MSEPKRREESEVERLPVESLLEVALEVANRIKGDYPSTSKLLKLAISKHIDAECTRNAVERWKIEKLRKRHKL